MKYELHEYGEGILMAHFFSYSFLKIDRMLTPGFPLEKAILPYNKFK